MSKIVIEKLKYPHKISLYWNGKYIYYYFRWKNEKYQGSTGTDNLDESKNKVSNIFFEISKGIREKGSIKIIKFEDIVKKFLDFKVTQNRSSRTLDEYRKHTKFLIKYIKEKKHTLETICSKQVYYDYSVWRKNYYEKHEDERRVISKKNGKLGRVIRNVGVVPINRECRFLVSVLKYSKDYLGYLKNVNIPSYTIFPENRREDILTKGEYLELQEYWMKKNSYYWYIMSFLNNTGIRYPQELLNITYSDVHLDEDYVLIRNRKSKSGIINTQVPLVGRSKEIINILKSRDDIPKQPQDFVFLDDNGKQIKNIGRSFKKSLVDLNINSNITLYSLRHLFVTRMIKRPDITMKILSEVVGHKNVRMIDQRYSHLKGKDYIKQFKESEEHRQKILKELRLQREPESKDMTDLDKINP